MDFFDNTDFLIDWLWETWFLWAVFWLVLEDILLRAIWGRFREVMLRFCSLTPVIWKFGAREGELGIEIRKIITTSRHLFDTKKHYFL